MSKTLIIHIGTHKTGSTTIQRSLEINQELLRQKGVEYIQPPRELIKLETCNQVDSELVRSIRDHLNKHTKKNTCYLMSSEGFSGNPLAGYANAGVVAESIKNATEGIDVRIVVYLRRQDEFVESLYAQMIHEGESYSFEEFVNTLTAFSLDWESLLSSYSSCFGEKNVITRRYNKAFLPESDSLLNDFYSVLGLDFGDFCFDDNFSKENSGYSRDALEIARISNPYLNRTEKWRLRQVLQKISAKRPFEKYLFWPEERRDKFIAEYSESNSRVARQYCNELSGLLFPYQGTYGDNPHQRLSVEDAVPILVKAILTTGPFTVRFIEKAERKIISSLIKFPRLTSMLQRLRRKLGI